MAHPKFFFFSGKTFWLIACLIILRLVHYQVPGLYLVHVKSVDYIHISYVPDSYFKLLYHISQTLSFILLEFYNTLEYSKFIFRLYVKIHSERQLFFPIHTEKYIILICQVTHK
jgi:hypothetical protein